MRLPIREEEGEAEKRVGCRDRVLTVGSRRCGVLFALPGLGKASLSLSLCLYLCLCLCLLCLCEPLLS